MKSDFELVSFTKEDNSDLYVRVARLRMQVWRAVGFKINLPDDQDEWTDERDVDAFHVAIVRGDDPLAAARVHVYSALEEVPYSDWFGELSFKLMFPLGFFSRLVVHPDFQRNGFSDLLDEARYKFLHDHQAQAVLMDVPEYRIEPLQRRGWTVVKEPQLGIVFPTVRWAAMYKKLGQESTP